MDNFYNRIITLWAILVMLPFSGLYAQKKGDASAAKPKSVVKKALSDAKQNLKKGANLEGTEQQMRSLLKDSTNLEDEKIWLTLFEAVKKQYEQLNEKLYLKQQSDTAKFFINTLHMFDVLESLDSIDAKPGKNGKSSPKFRKSHASYLDQYRSNLFGGGLFFVKKQNFADAYRCFFSYLDCAQQPIFSDYKYMERDERMSEAAYWTMLCGYKLSRPEIILDNRDLAMRDASREIYILQYEAEAYMLLKDDDNYCRVLEEGFEKYPSHGYFFPHLAILYGRQGRDREVLTIADKALQLDRNNTTALVAASTAYLHLEQYDESVACADRLIELDPKVAVGYLNAGLSYYNQTVPLAEKKKPTKNEREQMLSLYRRALPYLEQFRTMRPDEASLWATPLYNVYLNLNMGDKFEEIEDILTKMQ